MDSQIFRSSAQGLASAPMAKFRRQNSSPGGKVRQRAAHGGAETLAAHRGTGR